MKEKSIKYGTILLTALSFIFLIIAMYGWFSKQDTLTVGIFYGSNWDVPGTEHYRLFNRAIERFHEEYPNIKVKYEEGIPADDYSEWLAGQILKGSEPDVYLVLPEDFSYLIKIGALQSLNGNILSDSDFSKDLFYTSAYEAGTDNGIPYALPLECNPRMMFVNKTLLKKEGIEIPSDHWTWEDFYEICSKVIKDTDGDEETDQYGFYDYTWLDAVYSNGIRPFDEDGKNGNFTEIPFIQAISFQKKLDEIHENYKVTSNDFDLGRVAFRPLSFSEYRTYMPYPWRIKKYTQFEWNCIPMPSGPRGDNSSKMDVLMLGMSARTTKKNLAWQFMKMLTTDEEIQKYVYENTSGASALISTNHSKEVLDLLNQDTPGDSSIDMPLLSGVVSKGIVPYHFPEYDTQIQYVDNSIQRILETDEELNLAMFHLKNEIRKK